MVEQLFWKQPVEGLDLQVRILPLPPGDINLIGKVPVSKTGSSPVKGVFRFKSEYHRHKWSRKPNW